MLVTINKCNERKLLKLLKDNGYSFNICDDEYEAFCKREAIDYLLNFRGSKYCVSGEILKDDVVDSLTKELMSSNLTNFSRIVPVCEEYAKIHLSNNKVTKKSIDFLVEKFENRMLFYHLIDKKLNIQEKVTLKMKLSSHLINHNNMDTMKIVLYKDRVNGRYIDCAIKCSECNEIIIDSDTINKSRGDC